MFTQELNFFISHQDELVKKYPSKTLALQGEKVLGVYESPLEAYLEVQKEHQLGTFMIQPCESGTEAYTVTVSSYSQAAGDFSA